MGYACPVCETPQADARHLANHLAFTALLGDEAHETWLSEHTPGWGAAGDDELADRVVEHADETEFPQVFEDTTGHVDHDHDAPRPGDRFVEERRTRGPGTRGPKLDSETRDAIEEAHEMTRRAHSENGTDDEHAADENE